MKEKQKVWLGSPKASSGFVYLFLSVGLLAQVQTPAQAQEGVRSSQYIEENHQVRRDKFDLVLPQVMRENGIDMWIHAMREAIPDSFGADELGSTSGVFLFTDRGGDRIERAILGRRAAEGVGLYALRPAIGSGFSVSRYPAP